MNDVDERNEVLNNVEEESSVQIPFNKQMRKATRQIHAVSDTLVNAKLAFALSDNAVWAEGLLVFYEIFRFLEGAMIRLKNSHLDDLNIDGLQRTEAFEKDLEYYLGSNWNNNYSPRESVAKYLLHLQNLERTDPTRLIAYVYHLYMGLLSGGQILRAKRTIFNKFGMFTRKVDSEDGNAVTDFGEKRIHDLKKEIIRNVNRIAEELDDNERQGIIEESKIVFQLNNSIISTVKGTKEILLRKLLTCSLLIGCILIFYIILIRS